MSWATTHSLPVAEGSPFDIVVAVLLTLLGIGLLIGIIAVVRKRFMAGDAAGAADGFSLGGLRDLVRQGKMTPEEYERAKAGIVAATHKATAKTVADNHPDLPGRRIDPPAR